VETTCENDIFNYIQIELQYSDMDSALFALALPTSIVQFDFEVIPVDGNRAKDAQFGKQREPHLLHPYTLIPYHSAFLQ
jgi:hypothetical protein